MTGSSLIVAVGYELQRVTHVMRYENDDCLLFREDR